MNKCFIIGNLTGDPESRSTQNGINLCTFTVAVNRKQSQNGQQDADFFRVTAWRQLGDICAKYLAKGRKVAVTGSITANAYNAKDGTARASLELQAEDVEFLTPKENNQQAAAPQPKKAIPKGYTEVDEPLPF